MLVANAKSWYSPAYRLTGWGLCLMKTKNSLLDDLCADIGYTATSILAAWFGGRRIWVPPTPVEAHAIARLIGMPAFRQLASNYGGTVIHIPKNAAYTRFSRWRAVCVMLSSGKGMPEIIERTGLSMRHIKTIRRFLEDSNILPMILTEPGTDDAY